jgi:hypothetical protein
MTSSQINLIIIPRINKHVIIRTKQKMLNPSYLQTIVTNAISVPHPEYTGRLWTHDLHNCVEVDANAVTRFPLTWRLILCKSECQIPPEIF